MTTRRPRNIVSRSAVLSARAAELLDEGDTDAAVAAVLSQESGQKVKAAAVAAFRKGEYARVCEARLARRDAAKEAQLVIAAAREAGATFAQAGTDVLAKLLFDVISAKGSKDAKELIAAGKMLAKLREIEIAQAKAQVEIERARQAAEAVKVTDDKNLTAEEKAARIRQIFGMQG